MRETETTLLKQKENDARAAVLENTPYAADLTAQAVTAPNIKKVHGMPVDHPTAREMRRNIVKNMQKTHGNRAVQRFLARQAPAVQRNLQSIPTLQRNVNVGATNASPPATVATGRFPANHTVEDIPPATGLADRILAQLPSAFRTPGATGGAQIRSMCNQEVIRNNFNALFGDGYQITLTPATDLQRQYTGDVTLRARIRPSSVTFIRADGVQIGTQAQSGVGTSSTGSLASTSGGGLTGGAGIGGHEGGPSASGEGNLSSSETATSGGAVAMGGSGTRTASPAASVLFHFDVEYSATIRYQARPRAWNTIMSLGLVRLISEVMEHPQTRQASVVGRRGQVRFPARDCTEIPAGGGGGGGGG